MNIHTHLFIAACAVCIAIVNCSPLPAGEVKALPDKEVNTVSNVDQYDIKPALEEVKKLNAWFTEQVETRGLKELANVLQEGKAKKNKIVSDALATFETKRRQEYANKLRLVKTSEGKIKAGKANLWGPGKFDRVTVVVTADKTKWLYENDKPFTVTSKGGTGAGVRHSGPKIEKPDNGVSVWAEVRGPDRSNIQSGHTWWEWRTEVTFKPTAATINPRVAADKTKLEPRLRQEVEKVCIF